MSGLRQGALSREPARRVAGAQHRGDNELHRAALAGNGLARVYARVVGSCCKCRRRPERCAAIGAHGQTVRHRPGEFDGGGYTMQINNPRCSPS